MPYRFERNYILRSEMFVGDIPMDEATAFDALGLSAKDYTAPLLSDDSPAHVITSLDGILCASPSIGVGSNPGTTSAFDVTTETSGSVETPVNQTYMASALAFAAKPDSSNTSALTCGTDASITSIFSASNGVSC